MNQSEVMSVNAHAREKRKEKLNLHHVEVHPERNAHGKLVRGGGYVVHTVMRREGEDWGDHRAEKPFGAGKHEEMLAHVANELKLPEPKDGEEQDGEGAEPAYE